MTPNPWQTLLLLATIACLSSCRTYFDAQFLRPGKTAHPAHLNTLLLAQEPNQQLHPNTPYAADGLARTFERNTRYGLVAFPSNHTDSTTPNPNTLLIQALHAEHWPRIDSLCQAAGADGVVWLKKFKLDTALRCRNCDNAFA